MASKKHFTAHVHLLHNFETVSFAPGDLVPDWADELVTNPDAFEVREASKTSATPEPAGDGGAGGDGLDDLKAAELKDIAKELGIPARGNKADLVAAIRAKRAEAEPEPAAGEDGGQSAGRAALDERAQALGLEVDPDWTDEELETAIEAAE